MQRQYRHAEDTLQVDAKVQGDQLIAQDDHAARSWTWQQLSPGEYLLQSDGRQTRCVVAQSGEDRWVWVDGVVHSFKLVTSSRGGGHAASNDNLLSPMPGLVLKVFVQPGDQVESNQVLVVLEAMKMQYEITAPRAATVSQVLVAEGQQVEGAVPLVHLEEEET